jgi:hypothetical protein
MNSAYDDLTGFVQFRAEAKLSGTGGEIIRGGFLRDQRDVSAKATRARIEQMFTSGSHMLVPEANARAREALDRFREGYDDPADAMAALYLLFRTGRWMVGPRTSTELNWISYHPFLDNVVAQRAGELPALTRWGERPAHGLIARLAPQLKDLPIEGRRWQYEATRPQSLSDLRGWLRRSAARPRGRTSSFDYRRHHDRPFVEILREAIMDGPPALFELVNRDVVEKIFTTAPVRNAGLAWRLLTVSVLLSGSWRRGAWPKLPDVEVPLPPS